MSLLVLGPLDTGADPLSPRERVILAALVVRRGKGVAPAELADALWGEQPPATWEQQVRNTIARIRAKLGRESIETASWEYRLAIDLESIDAVRFERLISSARQHALHGEHDRSVDAYRKALALWRGLPLPELAAWEPGTAETARLVELHVSAEEELLDARLRAGEDRAVIPEAEQRVLEAPLREDRWAILALANYRANRQADALAVLRAARARLDEELGVEPGPRITELETAILRHDSVLDAPLQSPRESVSCPYPGLVPFGPADAESFFGRDADIEAVHSRLRPRTITTIAGPSGCGKSSLLLAGIVPELRSRGRHVEVIRPGTGGVPGLARLTRPDAGLDVLAIDQAEELLGLAPSDIDAFCDDVSAFLARGGSVVLTVRSDFLDRMGALPAVGPALGRGIHLLTGLDAAGLHAAIEGPAHLAGLRLESGLVELVLRDAAGRPAVLPHLSHALVETWVRREGLTLTVEGYETAGGIAGAIARSAESVYQSMSAEEQAACRSIMLRLIGATDRAHR